MKKIRYQIGVLSLLLSCLALMLAILPPCLLEQKIREIEGIESADRVDDAAVSLEIEGVREKFVPSKDPDSQKILVQFAKNDRKIKSLKRLSAFFTAIMVLTAVAAMGTAIYSWGDKEHGKEICIGSLITTAVALSWQYIGAGVSAGVGVFVFIVLVAGFS